jgi:S1-C subfamily serine protease
VSTTWSGKDSSQGSSELKFHFLDQDRVLLFDRDDAQPGSYRHTNNEVTLTFFGGALTYTGTIADDAMKGAVRRGRGAGIWEVTRKDSPGAVFEPTVQLTVKGTGILVDRKQKLILTNCHVVGDARTLELHFPKEENGRPVMQRDTYKKMSGIRGKVVMREERCDLALVQLDSLPASAEVMPLSSTSAKPAQSVHALGNPTLDRTLWSYADGRIRRVDRDNWKLFDDFAGKLNSFEGMRIETVSPVCPGDSGGPLVNERGTLVGIASGGNVEAETGSSFIDVSEIRSLLNATTSRSARSGCPSPSPSRRRTWRASRP